MRATNRTRRFGTYVTGTLAGLQVAATADRNDFFNTATSLTTYGAMPRVNISRPERPIARVPGVFRRGRRVRHAAAQHSRRRREDE